MSDIYDIKNLIFFLPHLRAETWYAIGTSVMVYVIYIAFLIFFRRYERAKQTTPSETTLTITERFLKKLEAIDTEDPEFFAKINLLVRTYLERMNILEKGSTKTPKEVANIIQSKELSDFLEKCTLYEYGWKDTDNTKKRDIKSLAEAIILQFGS